MQIGAADCEYVAVRLLAVDLEAGRLGLCCIVQIGYLKESYGRDLLGFSLKLSPFRPIEPVFSESLTHVGRSIPL